MNKDEMIEEMAKIANFSAFDFKQGTIRSKTIYTAMAEALYNANCRIIADDEIVESMKTYERARHETAREILQELYSTPHEYHEKKIVDLAQKYGIDEED